MLPEASSLFLILCLQPIFSGESRPGLENGGAELSLQRCFVRAEPRKILPPRTEIHPRVQIKPLHQCAFSFDTSEMQFVVLNNFLLFTSCLVVLPPPPRTHSDHSDPLVVFGVLMSFTCSRLSSRVVALKLRPLLICFPVPPHT